MLLLKLGTAIEQASCPTLAGQDQQGRNCRSVRGTARNTISGRHHLRDQIHSALQPAIRGGLSTAPAPSQLAGMFVKTLHDVFAFAPFMLSSHSAMTKAPMVSFALNHASA